MLYNAIKIFFCCAKSNCELETRCSATKRWLIVRFSSVKYVYTCHSISPSDQHSNVGQFILFTGHAVTRVARWQSAKLNSSSGRVPKVQNLLRSVFTIGFTVGCHRCFNLLLLLLLLRKRTYESTRWGEWYCGQGMAHNPTVPSTKNASFKCCRCLSSLYRSLTPSTEMSEGDFSLINIR